MRKNRELLTLLFELSKTIRCSQQDAIFKDITFQQFYILDLVAQKGRMRLSELHQALAVEKSTTTRLVEPLIRQRLILREKFPEDARAVDLRLTEKGAGMHGAVWDCVGMFLDSLERKIPKDKRKDVYEAVKIFINALQGNCSLE